VNFNFQLTRKRKLIIAGIALAPLGKRVAISYQQHKGVPTTCFGETEYCVIAVKVVE
jgi:hypothetical protein